LQISAAAHFHHENDQKHTTKVLFQQQGTKHSTAYLLAALYLTGSYAEK